MDNLKNLQSQLKSFEDKVASTKGKLDLIEEQYALNQDKLDSLKELKVINTQAIEILNLVQTSTREKIKEIFETTVTYALQYIHQSNDYKFELEFDRRGNVPKLSFRLKTPDMQGSHDIMNCRAGGSKDIVALALRFVLLEISKYPGFLFLDEPFKRLDSSQTINKAIEFIKENQKASKRQMLIIAHEQEVVDAVPNPIILTKKSSINKPRTKETEKPKRKRGRPKGKSNESNSKN